MGDAFEGNTFRSVILIIVALLHTVPIVSSSSNRNNYNVYNYDQTTPQFTPDGRLLQVEYASSAADSSPPLVVVEFSSHRSTSSSTSTKNTSGGDYDHKDIDELSLSYPCTVLITIPKQPASLQNRIVIIDNNDSGDPSDVSLQGPRHPSFCLAMSGILADSLALLQAGMKVAADYSLQYQDSFGMESLARALADECQSRVFAGGLRPYGSTLLLCGYDDRVIADNQKYLGRKVGEGEKFNGMRQKHEFESLIYQTDPSGGILQHQGRESADRNHPRSKVNRAKQKHSRRHGAPIRDNVASQVRCIVGGTSDVKRQLHKKISHGIDKFEQRRHQHRNRKELSSSLAHRIANVARILIKETAGGSGTAGLANNNVGKSRISKSHEIFSLDDHLEIVIISPISGCYRLEGKQLQAIKELINDDK